jgi:hypothetical protein
VSIWVHREECWDVTCVTHLQAEHIRKIAAGNRRRQCYLLYFFSSPLAHCSFSYILRGSGDGTDGRLIVVWQIKRNFYKYRAHGTMFVQHIVADCCGRLCVSWQVRYASRPLHTDDYYTTPLGEQSWATEGEGKGKPNRFTKFGGSREFGVDRRFRSLIPVRSTAQQSLKGGMKHTSNDRVH